MSKKQEFVYDLNYIMKNKPIWMTIDLVKIFAIGLLCGIVIGLII